MKKTFFFFSALLASIAASATVTVTPLNVNYNAKTVTFRVEYASAANNRAWVWIDLCPVSGVTSSTFQTAVISAVSVAGGSWDNTSLNGRGFYVTTNPSTVTATLSNAAGKFNWCAYGSDYPPNAVANGSSYTLKGSPPFILTTSSGTVEVNAKIYSGSAITALTDATGCPGVWCGRNDEAMGVLGCCSGTIDCSGTCKTPVSAGTYTSSCASCGYRNVRYADECNNDTSYGTISDHSCTSGCTRCQQCVWKCVSPYIQAHFYKGNQNECSVCSGYYGQWSLVRRWGWDGNDFTILIEQISIGVNDWDIYTNHTWCN
jgi:hypothetical protein